MNRTMRLIPRDRARLKKRLLPVRDPLSPARILGRTLCADVFRLLPLLPAGFADLVFVDPPYNLTKTFRGTTFRRMEPRLYGEWLESWVSRLPRLMKPTASLYFCGDWRSSGPLHDVLGRHFVIQNRITFEREKGRGAERNWKNCSEDLWFCTLGPRYRFDVEAVKMKRRVLAPYRDGQGRPKDWKAGDKGNWRVTHPSNLWTDITIPFWSMPENTDHPTQKPEKLLAKVILASSKKGDVVFDPFLGSGTTSVVAKKLGRRWVGIEIDETYCCLAEKRLELAGKDKTIQGYRDGVFWERNAGTVRIPMTRPPR